MLSRHHRQTPQQRTDQGCADRGRHTFVRYLGWTGYGHYEGPSQHLDETLNPCTLNPCTLNPCILAFGELGVRLSLLFGDGRVGKEARL